MRAPSSATPRVALVVGAGAHSPELMPSLAALRASGARVRQLYLDASTEVLVRRYESTRRRHPLLVGGRGARRRHRAGAGPPRAGEGGGRRGRRHLGPERPRAARPHPRAVRRGPPDAGMQTAHRVLRLQARAAGRRRRRARLPLPAQPALDRGPAAADRARRRRCARYVLARSRRGSSFATSTSSSTCCSPPTWRRARRTSPSPSGAPAAGTGPWPSPRRWPTSSAPGGSTPRCVHRDVRKVTDG